MNENEELEQVSMNLIASAALRELIEKLENIQDQNPNQLELNIQNRFDISFILLDKLFNHIETMRLFNPNYDLLELDFFEEYIATLPIFTNYDILSESDKDRLNSTLKKFKYSFDPVKKEITFFNAVKQDKYTLPVNKIVNNSKATHKLFDIESQEKLKNKSYINILPNSSPEELKKEKAVILQNLTPDKSFNMFDEIVFNAITTIYDQGFSNFSANSIAKLITDGRFNNNSSSALVKNIRESIDKMNTTLIYLDASGHASEPGDPKYLFKSTLLTLPSAILIDDSNNEIEGYMFRNDDLSFSPLYLYNKSVNQLIHLPLIKNPKLNLNKQSIMIRDYLNQRIVVMKKSKQNIQSIIRFDTIAKKTNIQYSIKTEKSRLRKKVCSILDCFIENDIIKGYDVLKDGQEKTKVNILL